MSGEALAVVKTTDPTEKNIYESLALRGDMSMLDPKDKAVYLERLCKSLGLNPYTQPFIPLKLNNKEVLYASRGATDQLASVNKLTREVIKTERIEDVYIATCKVSAPDGRFDISTGAVTIGNLKGDSLANALMKAETKAKRRATLSFCGLGFLDESELETIPKERIEYPKPATKGALIEEIQKVQYEVVQEEKFGTAPIIEAEVIESQKQSFSTEEQEWRREILSLMAEMKLDTTKVLSRFDQNPDKRETGIREIRKAYIKAEIKNFTEIEKDNLFQYAGIVTLEDATTGALKRAVERLQIPF